MQPKLPFITLILLISFASVNAVLFTPALPSIAHYFAISANSVQQTMTWFLIGYALGQLIYGPLANRFGRKPALYGGISLQILSSMVCALSGLMHSYLLLVLGRLLLALGSGVGLKMTFTLVNECYERVEASKLTSYLMLSFAITSSLGVALGGFINTHLGWQSTFYVGAMYGLLLLQLTRKLPETLKVINPNALKFAQLSHGYLTQFKNGKLVSGSLIMGGATAFFYVFAALAPFIAISIYGLNSSEYGLANLIPSIGLVLGSVVTAQLVKHFSAHTLIKMGILIALLGSFIMWSLMHLHAHVLIAVFLPMICIYFGLSFIMGTASSLTMGQASDKAYGSAVMSFLNMGFATVVVLSLGAFAVHPTLLPSVFFLLCLGVFGLIRFS